MLVHSLSLLNHYQNKCVIQSTIMLKYVLLYLFGRVCGIPFSQYLPANILILVTNLMCPHNPFSNFVSLSPTFNIFN